MEIKEKKHFNNHTCKLCGIHSEKKCDEKRHKETGFCLSLFSNFFSEKVNFYLDDSIKYYLNKQSIIF